jgi:hypothetical protein
MSGTTTSTAPPPGRSAPAGRFLHPELVDLRTAWEAELRLGTAPDAVHHWCRSEHGWLLRSGLDRVLDPVLLPEGGGVTSFYRFTELGAMTAADLLRCLPTDYLGGERQNDGPTLGAVLRAVAAHPDRVRAHGYVIGPGRCDERITAEGVLVRTDDDLTVDPVHSPGCQCDVLERIAAGLGVDDALVRPHEVGRWRGAPAFPRGDGEHWYRLWWD